MSENFWDKLMADDDHASTYMYTYGEGPGCDTRHMLSQFINVGETVLDVGCGPGWNADHFAEYGPALEAYKGVDYSERFVRVANMRREAKEFPHDFVKPFELQDCRDLKEPDLSWDVIIIQDCLEHTNGYEKPIAEALRVAKKRIIVTFWHLTENDDHINEDGDDGWGAWYSRPKWEAFLNTLSYDWSHTSFEHGENKRIRDYYIIDKEL